MFILNFELFLFQLIKKINKMFEIPYNIGYFIFIKLLKFNFQN